MKDIPVHNDKEENPSNAKNGSNLQRLNPSLVFQFSTCIILLIIETH